MPLVSFSRRPARLSFRLALMLSTPLAPAAADTVFRVDFTQPPRAISPLIYGLNDWSRDSVSNALGFTLERMGGNRMTGYNWETNFSNAGSDYMHHSDNLLVNTLPEAEQSRPGAALRLSVDHARAHGRPSLLTLPLAGYVAADGNGTVSLAQQAPSSRWKAVKTRKGGPYATKPDTSDDFVYLDELVNSLIKTYGTAAEGGVFAYSLDNEPALWASTHSRLHPAKLGVEELIERNADAAAMVKDLDPDAMIFGPALYGWGAYEDLQDAPDWASFESEYDWLISVYLGEMRKRSDAMGRRLLDVLDIHYYPAVAVVTGKDSSGNDVYTRITDSQSNDEALTQARLQATRSLWDASYVEQSWVTQWATGGAPLQVLPRVFDSIGRAFPETLLCISEYDFGGHQNCSGGLAQVDALGIFGRDGLYAACYWGEVTGFVVPAFRLFRDYDGEGSRFGDIALSTTNPNSASFSTYAALDSSTGKLHVILLNKMAQAVEGQLELSGLAADVASVSAYGFSEQTGPEIQSMDTSTIEPAGSLRVALPARSATHYALELTWAGVEVGPLRLERGAGERRFVGKLQAGIGQRLQMQASDDLRTWRNLGDMFIGLGNEVVSDLEAGEDRRFWRAVRAEAVSGASD